MNRKYSNKEIAQYILNNIKKYSYLTVENIIERKLNKEPPEGLKTTTILKKASSELSISPHLASNIAQELYMKGYILYPRTNSTKFSPSFSFSGHLLMFRKTILDFKDKVGFKNDVNVQKLLQCFYIRNINSSSEVEKGGSQPIIPTEYYYRDDLNNKEIELDIFFHHYLLL